LGPVLVVNAGSTSLKLALIDEDEQSEELKRFGDVEPGAAAAVGHRVVHGGARFQAPVVIDEEVITAIRELTPLAPLHNGPALDALAEARRRFPDVPHVAVFDTAFHATLPADAATYAVPERWRDEWQIRRYGFHGLSVQWSAEQVSVPRLVVCHLGGGCSVTAVRDGRSIDTTMGFSPLEGVPMTTRSGSVDPGAVLYLLREKRVSVDELDRHLERESGLLGLSGTSGDVRDLLAAEASGDAAAALALAVYVHRIAGAVATMTASLGGLDALVFTAGVGERSAPIRERVCTRLGFLGVELDARSNTAPMPESEITAYGSAVRVFVVGAREDIVVSRAVRRLVG
jgi:acetate kinase